mgnify:CR=1 FL=1
MHSSDLADVLVVSGLLFFLSKLLQQNIHRRVLLVFLTVAALFIAARSYQWELTLRFIQVIAVSLAVGFILVFQEDVRRFFESYIFQTLSSKQLGRSYDRMLESVIRAAAHFSKESLGALIVLQQRIPVAHSIRGGHVLNGEVSFALLCSIFDPHSDGHDGAAILEGAKMIRFGAHLPLSRNIAATGRSGTRHAAALGLSEVCDALIVVVSEESGTISLAHQGKMEKLTLEQLETRLSLLKKVDVHVPLARQIRQLFIQNWMLHTVCIAGAFFLWLGFAAPRNLQQRTMAMSVTLEDIPRDYVLDDPMPAETKVTLLGSQDAFERWSRESQLVHVTVKHVRPGEHKLALSSTNLSLPQGIFLRQFEPAVITLKVHQSRLVTVPVSVNAIGRMPTAVTKVKVNPETVKVLVRDGDPGPTMIMTEPIPFNRLVKGQTFDLRLIPPAKTQFSDQTPVSVRVALE